MTAVRFIRRALRPAGKRLQAMLRWRKLLGEAPPIFGNGKPKSGSHLLLQVLDGFTRIMPYAYVVAEPVRTIRKEGGRRTEAEVHSDLESIPRDAIGWGYVEAWPAIVAHLCQKGRVNLFIYRDPRDLLVSHVYYASDMNEEHGMHAYYRSLPDFGDRLRAAITGVDDGDVRLVSVRKRYEAVFEWLAQPAVLSIRFEDLATSPSAVLNRMLDEVERTGYGIPTPRARALEILQQGIQPHRSATFRSGKIGAWRAHFDAEHKRLFKDVAGDLLQGLGYEESPDW